MTRKIIVKSSCIEVHGYEAGDSERLERSLCYWDEIYYKVIEFALHYDVENKILYLPRGIDVGFVEKEIGVPAETNYDARLIKKSNKIRLHTLPRNELQKKSIAFLMGQAEFASNATRSQLILNLSTGAGKTYCTVAGIALSNTVPLILTHSDNIKGQWRDSFEAYTDIAESDILDIKSSSVIERIMKGKIKPKYRVYLANRQTIGSYCKKHGWDKLQEVFAVLGIGIKVFDEAHLTTAVNFKIDYYTNVELTYYLTATFARSHEKEDKIINLAFKNVPRYGEESREVLRKHIIYTRVLYDSKPEFNQRAEMSGAKGFDPNKFSEYNLNSQRFIDNLYTVIDSVLNMNPDKKLRCMLTTSTINSTNVLAEKIQKDYPDLIVGAYNSEMEQADKLEVLNNANIIVTTIKGLGTGSDIEGLRFLINTVPYKSKVTADQLTGRLRYRDEKGTVYFEMIDKAFNQILKWDKHRSKIIYQKTKKNLELNL